MVAARSSPPVDMPPGEVRLLLHGVSWKDYVIAREALDSPALRMTFCEGELELMSPSRPHEEWKKNIARMVELFALDREGEGSPKAYDPVITCWSDRLRRVVTRAARSRARALT